MSGTAPRVDVLGSIRAEVDGHAVELGGRQQRAVLCRLLAARGEVVSVDRIIDDLWHGEPPPSAISALQAYVSNLRRVLEPSRLPRTPATILVSTSPGYAIRLGADAVDAWEFESAVRALATVSDHERVAVLRDAVTNWCGKAYAEFADEPWARPEAARLHELQLVAREQLAEAALRCGNSADAALEAERLVLDAPMREEGWRLLALSQYFAGRQADALATLRRCRDHLVDELGIEPGPAVRQLEHDILNHSVAVPLVQLPPPVAEVPRFARPRSALVGRRAEQGALAELAAAAQPGQPAIAVIVGEAGAGKSALLDAFGDELQQQGWLVAVGRCPELDGGPAAWAIAEAFRTVARAIDPSPWASALAPLLTNAEVSTGRAGSNGRFMMHRAAEDWLDSRGDVPLALLIDDAHRADPETARLLTTLAAMRRRGRTLLVIAHRPDELPALSGLLGSIAGRHPLRMSLGGLDRDETNNLLTITAGFPVTAGALRTIHERTGGNPFFVAELGRAVAGQGERAALREVPQGIVDLVRHRLDRLPADTVTVLRTASVIGRVVNIDVLIRACGLAEQTVLTGLEAGVIDGLLVDDEPGTVSFAHVLLRDATYDTVTAVRRRSWHASVAIALRELIPDDVAAIAYHGSEAATPATAAAAADACVVAAERAEQRYAYETAADLYERAQRCLELAGAGTPALADIAMRRLPALVQAGRIDAVPQARATLMDLARQSRDADLLARALVAGTLPGSWPDRQYLEIDHAFIADLDDALARSDLAPRLRCLLLVTRARESAYSDDPSTAPSADEAVRLAENLGEPELLGLALVAQSESVLPTVDLARHRAVCAELRAVAEDNALLTYLLVAVDKELGVCLLANEPERCDALLAESADLAQKLQLPRSDERIHLLRGGVAHLRGDVVAAAAAYASAFELMQVYSPRDAITMEVVTHTSLAITADAGVADRADQLQFMYDFNPPASHVLGGVLACALLARGDDAGARVICAERPELVEDPLTSEWLAFHGLACASLGDHEACAVVFAALARYAGQVPGISVGFPMVPVDFVLARLARAMSQAGVAAAHRTSARGVAETWGNALWLELIEQERS